MLQRFRHLPPVDHAALESILLRVSEMACALPELAELDINPIVADETGALALDARVVLRAPPPGRDPYRHLAIHPYPAELESTLVLAGGEQLLLRPIRPEDAALESAFVAGLAPQTRRLRFASPLPGLTPEMLARFTQIDYDREMALLALAGGGGPMVAVARYVRLPDGGSAEFAIVVADEWQNRGVGRALLRRLAQVARERGVARLVGQVLAANRAMVELCTRLGMRVEAQRDDAATLRATLALDGPEARA
jgi:acetyltransferase